MRQRSRPIVLFATFSDLDSVIASSVNDNKFAELLKELVDTEVAYVAQSRSHNSLVLGYTRLLRKFLSPKRYFVVICRGPIIGTIGILLRRKVSLHLDDALFHSIEIEKGVLPVHTGFRSLDVLIFTALERFAISKADRYIVSTIASLNLLADVAGIRRDRIHTIPFFLEDALFSLEPPRRDVSLLKVGYTGNFMPHDKVLEIIDAVRVCKSKGLPVQLHMLGDGRLLGKAYERAGNLTGESIFFHGRISHSRIPEFLSGVDVVLSPMTTQIVPSTLPIKLLEGAASGRIVITTDSGAIRYFFRNSMIYASEPFTDSIAESLDWVRRNKTRSLQMAAEARAIAKENFSRKVSEEAMKQYLRSFDACVHV